jgi:hypothetical protein
MEARDWSCMLKERLRHALIDHPASLRVRPSSAMWRSPVSSACAEVWTE